MKQTSLIFLLLIGVLCPSALRGQEHDSPTANSRMEFEWPSNLTEFVDSLFPRKYPLHLHTVRSYSAGVHWPLLRIAPASSSDFSGPNPRQISNQLCFQSQPLPNKVGTSDAVWAWGQYLDHDISLTETSADNGLALIPVLDLDDPLYPMIPFTRSNFVEIDGQREQINEISHFIDASNVYGSHPDVANKLQGTRGSLLMGNNQLLPLENGSFLAGDIRANENLVLTSLHTLFAREHNRLAAEIAQRNPTATDEEIYQLARKIVGAEVQIITYKEFLPALLGDSAPSAQDYRFSKKVDPRIANEFSGALYRFGHSMLSGDLKLGNGGRLALRDAFLNPQMLVDNPDYLDELLAGLVQQPHQEIDTQVVEDVRSFLFGRPGMGGLDLASLNIQRGRDHGLPDYNTARVYYGLAPVHAFSQITSNRQLQQTFENLYGSVDQIDLWIGGLAEDHVSGTQVGSLIQAALIDQFTRLRDGDPLFYTRDPALNQSLVRAVIDLNQVTLGRIIRRNSNADVPNDVFHVHNLPSAESLVRSSKP